MIADQEKRIAAVEAKVKSAPKPTVAILRPGLEGGGLTVSGGPDFGTVLIKQAGGVNAFADLTAEAEREDQRRGVHQARPGLHPDQRVLRRRVDPASSQPEVEKILANPAFANLKAVRNKHVVPWLFANHSAGVRGANTTED